MESEKCGTGCGLDAVQFLAWKPGAFLVRQGGISVMPLCVNHPAAMYVKRIADQDPDAVFWVFSRKDGGPLVPGSYAS